jgi:four helix bundle protein
MNEQLGGEIYNKALELKLLLMSKVTPTWTHFAQYADAAGSVVANIAEGNGRNSGNSKYYTQFLLFARGSAYETCAWIDIAVGDGLIEKVLGESLKRDYLFLGDNLMEIIKKY